MRMILYIMLIITVAIISCSKKNKIEYHKEQYLKSCLFQYLFNSGSYWIYKSSVDSSIDSTYVFDWSHKWSTIVGGSIKYSSSRTQVERLQINYASSVRDNYSEVFADKSIMMRPPGYYSYYFYKEDVTYQCDNFTVIDSINISNTIYYDVKLSYSYDSLSSFYRKDSIGIIRWIEYNESDSVFFDLVDFNVNFFQKPE